jgi:hypothetical protein
MIDILKHSSSNLPILFEIKESLLRNLTEISKHHSIRSVLLTRKVLSKLMKHFYDMVLEKSADLEEETAHVLSVLNQFVSLIITLASVSSNKFYIPGETKEVEALRRKAIGNGLLIMMQAVLSNIKGRAGGSKKEEIINRFQSEVLDGLDTIDFRQQLYTVYSALKNKLGGKPEERAL